MVEILGAPIIISCSYDPSYKVDICLHEQLWGGSMTSNDLAIEVMTLISELEVLCDKETQQGENFSKFQKGSQRKTYMATFETQAALLRDKLEKLMREHPEPKPNSLQVRDVRYVDGVHRPLLVFNWMSPSWGGPHLIQGLGY
ncbi:uncharacterized protein LOC115922618 [Strongylocentrotus purpuratus]|uniref:Uncharacterized protein n=1 Tax=Strongylocentrotus purpuratus TaxID=7668 RepID=A0A7M7NM12_STRPU|nr:uncharacterized protein LOC115922618 [Strongylocentrotus purpuratus]